MSHPHGWKKSVSDFSEIDTSDVAPDLSLTELPSFDLRDIITGTDDQTLSNTDYINNNQSNEHINDTEVTFSKDQANEDVAFTSARASFCKRPTVVLVNCNRRFDVNGNADSNLASKDKSDFLHQDMLQRKQRKADILKRSGFPCIVCKKKFDDKNEMKKHVRGRHLRPSVLCSVCGKRVFQDKLLHHFRSSCMQ